jgi:hypothetical protein
MRNRVVALAMTAMMAVSAVDSKANATVQAIPQANTRASIVIETAACTKKVCPAGNRADCYVQSVPCKPLNMPTPNALQQYQGGVQLERVQKRLPPGTTNTLNPQPIPPGASQGRAKQQRLPPGTTSTLNPQPLPPGGSQSIIWQNQR